MKGGVRVEKKIDYKGIIKKIGMEKLIIILICGIALIYLSVPAGENDKKNRSELKIVDKKEIEMSGNEYSKELEYRLKEILNRIDGISEVNVMITLKSGNESVVLTEDSIQENERRDTDENGAVSEQSEYKKEEVVVYEKNSNGETIPYVVKENVPKVEGVAIIAKGAEKTENMIKITSVVKALFDVEVHKISVVGIS
ncbi:MAG: hypothetical protein IJA34_03615 [Lachnospiraceae bacterium]|nr:hypothetical protein [Lachnospiraceae bacterium]